MAWLLLKESGMNTRAAALVLALSFAASSAFARSISQSFRVGAVVVRSARVTASAATVGLTRNGVRVEQVASRGTPPPMVQIGTTLKSVIDSIEIPVAGKAGGDVTVTIFY